MERSLSDSSRSATSRRCSASDNLSVVGRFPIRSLDHSRVNLCLRPRFICNYITSEMIVRLYSEYQILLALNVVHFFTVLSL
jgi:hypothetical protein